MVGAVGTVAAYGVIEADAADAADGPTPLVAVIVNVYAWPWTKAPVTANGEVVPE